MELQHLSPHLLIIQLPLQVEAMIWGYVAITVIVVGAIYFLYRLGYSKGYKEGREDEAKAWQVKVEKTMDRINDVDDTGLNVSVPKSDNVWPTEGPKP